MKILHVVPYEDEANGVYHVARMLAKKQSDEGNETSVVAARDFPFATFDLHLADEVYVHGMWLPVEWRACWKVLKAKKANHHSPTLNSNSLPRLVRMTHGSLSPIYLEHQGKWKKRLVAPIERWLFSKTDRVVTTGEWESAWCRQWGLRNQIETVDIKQFFKIKSKCEVEVEERADRALHLLYLGRWHPLKGVAYLRQAVAEVNGEAISRSLQLVELRAVSDTYGEELEKVWGWCDVLCLPTLSENFGLVVAEALERGKRVIVTDGAPAWAPPTPSAEANGQGQQWWDRVSYLRGYRDGTDEERVKLLKDALFAAVFVRSEGARLT